MWRELEHLNGGPDVVEWDVLATRHAQSKWTVTLDAAKETLWDKRAGAELSVCCGWKCGWTKVLIVQGRIMLRFISPW